MPRHRRGTCSHSAGRGNRRHGRRNLGDGFLGSLKLPLPCGTLSSSSQQLSCRKWHAQQGSRQRTAGSSSCVVPPAAVHTPRRPTCSGAGERAEGHQCMRDAHANSTFVFKSVHKTCAHSLANLQPRLPTRPLPTCASSAAGTACPHSSPARGCCCRQTSPPGCSSLPRPSSTPAAAQRGPQRGYPAALQRRGGGGGRRLTGAHRCRVLIEQGKPAARAATVPLQCCHLRSRSVPHRCRRRSGPPTG